jgi:sulfatase maturation enzyme AslB (radical SAM superfamily)
MYHSGNEFPYQYLMDDLDLKSFECAKDPHGNNFSTFTTNTQKRVSHITRILETFNQENPSKAIQIEALAEGLPIKTFDKNSNYQKHHIILAIREASEKKRKGIDVFYRIWNKKIQIRIDDYEEMEREAEDCAVQEVVMQEDPSAFQCSGDQSIRSASAKSTSRATRLLETDMIPSSLNPVSSKRNPLSSTKPASLAGKLSLYIN